MSDFEKKRTADDLVADFYEVEATPAILNTLRVVLDKATPASTGCNHSSLEAARRAIEVARPMRNELPLAFLPWGEVEAAAREQGATVADVIWDRAGRPTTDDDEAAS